MRFLSTPSARRATIVDVERRLNILFLSTPSARRATHYNVDICANNEISIHALREEGDIFVIVGASRPQKFLSTPSARRATAAVKNTAQVVDISIHALREEGDQMDMNKNGLTVTFLSTPSARRATTRHTFSAPRRPYFYPRPPRGGRPGHLVYRCRRQPISIHALREEGDVPILPLSNPTLIISIHALREEGDD